MTLAEFLKQPTGDERLCGRWVARWLEVSGVSDLIARVDWPAAEAAGNSGNTFPFALEVLAREGFSPGAALFPGLPVCVRVFGRETIGICVSARAERAPVFAVMTKAGVAVGPFKLVEAWQPATLTQELRADA